MKLKTIRVLGIFSLVVVLFICAYLTKIAWLWIVAVGTLVIAVVLYLRHLVNGILDENNEEEKPARMFILPRPSGLGSQSGVAPTAGTGSNSMLVKQDKRKDEQVGETHAYLPESAWVSGFHKKKGKRPKHP